MDAEKILRLSREIVCRADEGDTDDITFEDLVDDVLEANKSDIVKKEFKYNSTGDV